MKNIGIIVSRNKENNRMSYEILEIPKENRLDFYYEKLECELIGHVIRQIGDNLYDIIHDDEFLLKEENLKEDAIMIEENQNEMIFGKILICKYIENANDFKFFARNEIKDNLMNVMASMCTYLNVNTNEKFQAIRYKF